eukprot:GGOE01063425.1.p3 GENE.GGOE01063425.1~~GGOE01063425.1.p3  ORF type:complete len:289 (+),score=69.79 GGOE01063425.1:654-1520(+)
MQVRVINAEGLDPSVRPTEVFVRLTCGAATQFTQPAAVAYDRCEWNHDFIFVDLPTRPAAPGESAVEALVRIQVVGRKVGDTVETLLGSRRFDISSLPAGLVLTTDIPLESSGKVNLTLVGANFGPSVESVVAEAMLQQRPRDPLSSEAATATPSFGRLPHPTPYTPAASLHVPSPWHPPHATTPTPARYVSDATPRLSTASDLSATILPPQPVALLSTSWPSTSANYSGFIPQPPWPAPSVSAPAPYLVSTGSLSPPPAWPLPLTPAVGPDPLGWLPPTRLFLAPLL